MDDDKIKQLFDSFNPQMPPADDFMAELERNMNSVEVIYEQTMALARRRRRAAVLAALVGVAVGVVLTLLLPAMVSIVGDLRLPYVAGINTDTLCWCVVALASGMAAYGTFLKSATVKIFR